ncbi:flavonol sulfotransferase-like protein, partial [Trifolium medium]|nr:flavonol sulfotransferase-like protein [Trifolium medium]
MQRVLATKNKFRFVDGSFPIPDVDDLNYVAWERCNNLVHSWLINSMKPQVAESVVYIENAIDVWNDLKERYLQGDRVRVATLYQEISNFKQG